MRLVYIFGILTYSAGFALAACSPAVSQTAAPTTEAPAAIPDTATLTEIPLPSKTPAPPKTSFETAVYRDDSAGFELDYPESWTADAPQIAGDRGYIAQLTSWPRSPGEMPEEIPTGGTILSINVLLWDPKNALEEYLENRKRGWSASGFEIISEEQRVLDGNWPAARFIIKTPEESSFFLVTTIGEQYLVLGGSGDHQILEEIANSLRKIEPSE